MSIFDRRSLSGRKKTGLLCSAFFGFSLLAGIISAASSPARAELYFNIDALHLSKEQKSRLDLALLAHLSRQPPGKYQVSLSLNQRSLGEKELNFVSCGERLCPELSVNFLKELGVKVAAIPALRDLPQDKVLVDIAAFIPQASTDFNFDQRQLVMSIPQAALANQAQGYIPPEKWEEGIPMFFSSWNLSGVEGLNRSGTSYGGQRSQYLNLRNGINLGAWRLRNYSYYSKTGSIAEWRSLQSWLERDIPAWRARLIAGQTASPGLVFDSFSFRGLALASQDEMLPFSMRGYAPVIHGVAMTNATVEVRQNGNLLYQTFVPPGEFVIDDLYATGTSGDLEVTVREENGAVRKSIQAFATPPVSLRQGRVNYSLTAGEYGSGRGTVNNTANQKFTQLEAIYGLFSSTSVYGGAIAAQNYQAAMLGIGQSLSVLGAVSLDMTHAATHFSNGDSSHGESWRLRYSKQIESTGTAMTLAGYRFDTDGYYDFDEASNDYYAPQALRHSLRNRAQLTLSQPVGRFGSVALSAAQQTWWHQSGARTRTVTSSWSKNFGGVTVNLSQSMNKSWRTGKNDSVVSASLSVPLSKWLAPQSNSSLLMSNRLSLAHGGGSDMFTTLSGTALEDSKLSWSVAQARSQRDGKASDSTALFGSLQSSTTALSLGYTNYYGQSQRLSWAARGAIVAHPYGVTLAQPLTEGSSYALIRAPGAGKVSIVNGGGLATNDSGYAIVPSLAAYQENEVALDTSTLGDEIDLTDPVQKKVPAREALVLMDFNTRLGYRAFLKITHDGKSLPLGAVVSAGDVSGIADEKGQVYLTGVPERINLRVSLPSHRQCHVPFNVHNGKVHNGIVMMELKCKDEI